MLINCMFRMMRKDTFTIASDEGITCSYSGNCGSRRVQKSGGDPFFSRALSILEGAMSCDIHTHTPAQKSYTNFMLYLYVT